MGNAAIKRRRLKSGMMINAKHDIIECDFSQSTMNSDGVSSL